MTTDIYGSKVHVAGGAFVVCNLAQSFVYKKISATKKPISPPPRDSPHEGTESMDVAKMKRGKAAMR
jgi:hypothetical protein